VKTFELLGSDSELASRFRRKMAAAMY